jgi:GTP-binding protein HflX
MHVVEATGEETIEERMAAVHAVLADLGSSDIPVVLVMNKVDLLEPAQKSLIARRYRDALAVSALTGEGIPSLLDAIASRLTALFSVTLSIPAVRGDILSALYRDGAVTERQVVDEHIVLAVDLPREKVEKYHDYVVPGLPKRANNHDF